MDCVSADDLTGCARCGEGEMRPNPIIMTLRFLAFGAGVLIGLVGLVRNRRGRELAAWLGGWALFLTVPRYLICASCSNYGELCYSYYLGRYTSLVFPKREKEVSKLGLVLEIVALSTVFGAPVLGMRDDRVNLLRYLSFIILVLAVQFFHACRYCAGHSDDPIKQMCPSYRFWRRFN